MVSSEEARFMRSIKSKLIGSALLFTVLMLIVSLVSLNGLSKTQRETESLYSVNVKGLTSLASIRYKLMAVRYAAALVVSQSGEAAQRTVDKGHDDEAKLLEQITEYRALAEKAGPGQLAGKLEEAIKAYLPAKEITYQLALQGKPEAARQNMVQNAKAKFETTVALLDEGFKTGLANSESSFHTVNGVVGSSSQISLILMVVATLIGVGIALILANQISSGLRAVGEAAEGIARGELNQRLDIRSKDELGSMAASFQTMVSYLGEMASAADEVARGNLAVTVTPRSGQDALGTSLSRMVTNLRDIVSRVRQVADTVGDGSAQIASSSTELSKTVSVQASSAEETSAAMEQMAANIKSVDDSTQLLNNRVTRIKGQSEELAAAVTQTSSSIAELAASIQQVAGNVENANQASGSAAEAANAGDQAVAKTVAGMKAISETMTGIQGTIQMLDQRSGEIGAIIEVIDDIAEQTNLLALNAAIEAARAGEAGRGFAVVADEVRKLAERSAKATREIGDLIKGIQKETAEAVGVTRDGATKVEEGVKLASQTGEALSMIKAASQQVATLLGEISAASGEQARASSQIVTAAEQMASINQQVTGAVSEIDQLARTVTYATSEQRQGSDQVVIAVESLSRSAQEAATATEQVASTADELSHQAQQLQEAIAFFKNESEKTPLPFRIEKPLMLAGRV
ncbi:MAG TPA: methyl-accepting chemotaxis protein [Pantanalinema sp.]